MRGAYGVQVVLVGKAPVPGRSKTRLTPELTPEEAAAVASALLSDVVEAASATPFHHHVFAAEGDVAPWLPSDWEVIPQRGHDLGQRLCAAALDAWARHREPVLLVVTDTPLITPAVLIEAADLLTDGHHDAVLGGAADGGWWGLGVREPHPEAFTGVPMSTPLTGQRQLEVLRSFGWHVGELPVLSDVDVVADLIAVGPRLAPDSALALLLPTLPVERS